MACGLEFRQPSIEIRRLWQELRVLNDNLTDCVKIAEEYLSDLDSKVTTTKAYFVDIRSRIANIPKGEFVISSDLDEFLKMDENEAHRHFKSMRSNAAEVFEKISEERSVWMNNTCRLMDKQLQILNVIETRLPRLREARELRGRVVKTYHDIICVEAEVKGLQKVLFDCEVGKAELEKDYVSLIKSYQELTNSCRLHMLEKGETPEF